MTKYLESWKESNITLRNKIFDEYYDYVTSNDPMEQSLEKRLIWKNTANYIYYLNELYPINKDKEIEKVLELSKQYDIEVPSERYNRGFQFLKSFNDPKTEIQELVYEHFKIEKEDG